ncbi:TerC family protein [Gallaecimonas mangrovi]|uniref:TerC family protein n=1 Tax=Gallaecimonas mangrovi TaxID=2291597 RepID=UPI000E20364F|nr:TerC family protein [Gallaecimonas mangrovi]
MEWVTDPSAWAALATLTLLEIVLGIDNIIFISVLVGRLPEQQRQKGRLMGLGLAMVTRILLLLCLSWVMGLTNPWFHIGSLAITGRDSILILGGLFLIWKSTHEIHNSLEGEDENPSAPRSAAFVATLVQIAIIDIVFSLDSVITAVGLAKHLEVMIIAIVLSVAVMMIAAKAIGDFVDRHPTIKMLALSFLILVGFTLTVEGFGMEIPKGYVYFAMAFSLAVETLNIRARKHKSQAVHLRKKPPGEKR